MTVKKMYWAWWCDSGDSKCTTDGGKFESDCGKCIRNGVRYENEAENQRARRGSKCDVGDGKCPRSGGDKISLRLIEVNEQLWC